MNMHGYAFVMTPIDLLDGEGTEIAPKHRLVRASDFQIEEIKRFFERLIPPMQAFRPSPYEHDVRSVREKPGHTTYHYDPLPRSKWRYWIIQFEGTNSHVHVLEQACSLIPMHFEFGLEAVFGFQPQGPSFGWHQSTIEKYLVGDPATLRPKQIRREDLASIRQNFEDIEALPDVYPHIKRALHRYAQLNVVPQQSELLLIGLVSVVESLVSHAPKLTESADSLSHQLRTKIPLLRKRYKDQLDHENIFPGMNEEKLWTRIYSYRSKIVHGEDSKLSGDLQALGGQRAVVDFLRETIKRLLRLALSEPQFMTDIKLI